MEEDFSKAVKQFIGSQKGLDNDIDEFTNNNCKFPEDALDVSIRRACTDMMARTLGVKDEGGEKKGGECFTNDVIGKIKDRIIDYFKPTSNYYINGKFDAWHDETCNRVLCVLKEHYYTRDYKDKNNKNKEVKYGKAQKIVNMTFKYLLCFAYKGGYYDLYKERFENCHIPLDSYILKALFYKPRNGDSFSREINKNYGFLIQTEYEDRKKLMSVDSNGAFKIAEWDIKGDRDHITWSNIADHDDYKKIQEEVKKQIPDKDEFKKNPLVWENAVWTSVAGLMK